MKSHWGIKNQHLHGCVRGKSPKFLYTKAEVFGLFTSHKTPPTIRYQLTSCWVRTVFWSQSFPVLTTHLSNYSHVKHLFDLQSICVWRQTSKYLNEIFRATTREQPLNRRISGWWYIRFSGTFFLCRKPLILHLQECDGSILCYYETILQVRGKVYFQSEVLAHQHTLRQRWRSELRTHTHTHTVDISRPNESADSRHVSVSDTHTPLVLFPAAVGALKLWYLRNSNQFQTSASPHVSSMLI